MAASVLVAVSVFWKSVKPLFSDKSHIRDRISISEKGETLKTEPETTETINSLFSNIVTGPQEAFSWWWWGEAE